MTEALPEKPSRILVVDDDEAKRYTITRPLARQGLEIIEAGSAQQALERAAADPDLIILDVKLPDGSGFEVCEKLKANEATRAIPVLYVSAIFRTSEDRVKGLRGGADGYLITPINKDELIATVEVWLRVRQAERERKRLMAELRRERAFLEQVLEQLPVGVVIAEAPGGRIVFSNSEAQRPFGGASADSVQAYAKYPLFDVNGNELAISTYPLVRALAGEVVDSQETAYEAPSGRRILESRAAPVRQADGSIVGAAAVFSDVTERRQQEHRLQQLREELIGIIGHDLKNPVQAIKMGLRILELGDLPYRQQNAVARISSSTERIRRMIEDMLDFASSRLGGRIEVRRRPTDLGEVVNESMEELRTAHPRREVRREGEESICGAWDPDRLAQVASNLIGNALQHSPPDQSVTVRLERVDAHAILEVHNGGSVIPNEMREQIFAPFKRGVPQAEGRHVGLGLYITHQIVLAHGGQISVESSPDRGTTFRVTLPLGATG